MLNAQEKSRLEWSCRRGMLELDLILQAFLQKGLNILTAEQLSTFKELLTHTDPELLSWLMGQEEPYNKELIELVSFIRTHS